MIKKIFKAKSLKPSINKILWETRHFARNQRISAKVVKQVQDDERVVGRSALASAALLKSGKRIKFRITCLLEEIRRTSR